ncbi:MAG TPA: hypothetical protein VJA94_24515 [Candidatus Angelobacter sp.]
MLGVVVVVGEAVVLGGVETVGDVPGGQGFVVDALVPVIGFVPDMVGDVVDDVVLLELPVPT